MIIMIFKLIQHAAGTTGGMVLMVQLELVIRAGTAQLQLLLLDISSATSFALYIRIEFSAACIGSALFSNCSARRGIWRVAMGVQTVGQTLEGLKPEEVTNGISRVEGDQKNHNESKQCGEKVVLIPSGRIFMDMGQIQ